MRFASPWALSAIQGRDSEMTVMSSGNGRGRVTQCVGRRMYRSGFWPVMYIHNLRLDHDVMSSGYRQLRPLLENLGSSLPVFV